MDLFSTDTVAAGTGSPADATFPYTVALRSCPSRETDDSDKNSKMHRRGNTYVVGTYRIMINLVVLKKCLLALPLLHATACRMHYRLLTTEKGKIRRIRR